MTTTGEDPALLPFWVPQEAWDAYVEMRRKMRKPLTEYAARLAVKKLDALRQIGQDPKEVLDQSIFNGWMGLFAVRKEANDSGYLSSVSIDRRSRSADATRAEAIRSIRKVS